MAEIVFEESGPRTVQFKTFYWSIEENTERDSGQNEILFHVGGRTQDNKTVHIIIEGYHHIVYMVLPKRIKWNKQKCKLVFEYFQKTMKSAGPIAYWLQEKENLYYKKKENTICMSFPTIAAAKSIASKCKNNRGGIVINGVGTFRPGELQIHEQSIDPIIKFAALNDIKLASWLQVTEVIAEEDEGMSIDERRFTTADIDFRTTVSNIMAYEPENALSIVVPPKYLSFDIECDSENPNAKIPNPHNPANNVVSIATVVGFYGRPERRKFLFCLHNPKDITDATIFRFETEADMLLAFRDHIIEEDPDTFPGYNTMKFDWDYMISRSELLGIYNKFSQISRLIARKANLKTQTWTSSAYGEQQFRYLDAHGRINMDALIEIERNYKLTTYGLGNVAEYFLKQSKDDISARQLFMLVRFTKELTPVIEELPDGVIPKQTRINIKKKVQTFLPRRRCNNVILDVRSKLLAATTGAQFKDHVREPMTLIGKYNIQDSVLNIELCEKLNLWTTMESMSNIMGVPMSYLHTRGQQIKVLAQVFRETVFNDIFIPTKEKPKDDELVKYQGAVVIEANPGDYDNVVCFDFESLYPSVMIAFNICYTTLLEEGDPTPDEECHVLDWRDDVGCEHDPQKRKRKPEDILCKHHHYRFRKVVILPDGTRLHEGVMPRLERKLLSNRKAVKKEMGKLEAKLKMVTGLATEDDIAFYKKCGWPIEEKGSMAPLQIEVLKIGIKVLNAEQLSLKISANSAYGGLGAQMGFIPLVPGAASVTAKGRELIMEAIKFVLAKYKDIAKLVYGDTDSCMITFVGKTTDESFALGDKISKEISHFLKTKLIGIDEEYSIVNPKDGQTYRIDKYPRSDMADLEDEYKIKIYEYDANPVNLQFENLYKRYFLLTKKRYVARATNRFGQITAKINKGVVLARRDNCKYLKDTYDPIVNAILDKKTEPETMSVLYDQIHKLFTRQVPDANLIKYVGIKTVMSYAKKPKKQGKARKAISEKEAVYVDEFGVPLDPPPYGPLDERLVYPNLPQVMLALKLLRRGDEVPPNTRLEYIYLENDNASHQGDKAEDYTYYRENKHIPTPENPNGLKPDYLMYLDKQLLKPLTEMLTVKYKKEDIIWEPLEDAFNRCVEELSDLLRFRVKKIKKYEKSSADAVFPSDGVKVGWSTICSQCGSSASKVGVSTRSSTGCPKHRSITLGSVIRLLNGTNHRVYQFKGIQAQIQYILDSAAKKKRNPKVVNEIDETKYPELIKVCRAMKSRYVLDKLHVAFGQPKRKIKRPKQTGALLPPVTGGVRNDAYLAKKVGIYPRGTKVTLLQATQTDTGTETLKKYKKNFIYDVQVKLPGDINAGTGEILKGLSRPSLTSFRIKDSLIMADILRYRTYYKYMIKEIDYVMSPVHFVGSSTSFVINEADDDFTVEIPIDVDE